MKHSFKNDYSELAHPQVLADMVSIGQKQFEGYALDEYSTEAADIIRRKINAPSSDVHFIAGGTHANLVVISSALRSHEAVIAPGTGHIFMHETGAIEATGHKICTRTGHNGKLRVSDIESVLNEHGDDEHMVKPRLVYISMSSECGTVYTKSELSEISDYCRKHDLYLYIDGARFGVAMNSDASDLTYSDVAEYADAFFIGGTKNGALFGEAIIIIHEQLKSDFRYLLKQRGGLLSKSAAIGIQFRTLLSDGLYDDLAKHSIATAKKLADGIKTAGYKFLYPVESNLIIPILPSEIVEKLRGLYGFYDWQNMNDMTAIRMLTSWATPESVINEFIKDLES